MANAEQTPQEPRTTRKLVIIVVVLLAAALLFGVLAYRMATRDNTADRQQAIDSAECEHVEDNDLCKFFVSWELTGQYTIDASSTTNDQTTNYTLQNDVHDNFHLTASGDSEYEIIAIDNTIYTLSNDTWNEQTVEQNEVNTYRMDNYLTFPEPASEAEASAYAADDMEACGEYTCFKYRVALEGDATMHIWFDDDEYRLRQVTATDQNYTYEATLSYGDVEEITAPPEPTELPEDEYIPPGRTEPEPRPQPDADNGNGDGDDNGNGEDTPRRNGPGNNANGGIGPHVQGESTEAEEGLPAVGDQFDPEAYEQWRKQRESN